VVCAGAVVLVLRGPDLLRTSGEDAGGLMARLGAPDADGRLFGHFPYPEADPVALVAVDAEHRLHRDAAEAFVAMRAAAAADGIDLRLLSAYRSHSLQEEIFFEVMEERRQSARERARVSAPPGFSEHSTGFAIDLGDGRRPETHFSEDFASTEAFRWMQEHARAHRFSLSFPEDNPQGVNYEPWHWRYEGTVEALQLFEPAQELAG
jgi:D-alanyl-D-alanine carboxypeptidase